MVEKKITKTIKTFRAPNGQLYEGSIADYYEGRATPINDLGGTGQADSLPEGDKGETKEEK
jgi:hypothetical protein